MADTNCPLSEREIEVLQLVATGASNQEIAQELVISVNTVKVHLRNIFEKLGVQSRTEATLYAIRQGLVRVDEEVATGEADQAPADEETFVRPVHLWQRLVAVIALAVVSALLIWTSLPQPGAGLVSNNPISDQPLLGPAASARVATSRWVPRADLPSPRSRLALAAYGGRLYAIGGDNEDGASDQVDVFSPATNAWRRGQNKPLAVSNIAAVTVGDHIYVPGGCVNMQTATDTLAVYDPVMDQWDTRAPLLHPVCGYALAEVGMRLFVVGGWDGTAFVDTVQVYDVRSDSWQIGRPLPSVRGFAAAANLDGDLYVVGGYDGVRVLDETLVYDEENGQWIQRSPMNSARAGLGLAAFNGRLYAVGGGWNEYLATNEVYDAVNDLWSPFETPVLGEWRNLGVTVNGSEIYAIGGWNGSYVAVNEAYRVLFRLLLPVVEDKD